MRSLVPREYGEPNGAKFKKQNWLHVQQICFQGQGRFQSSSTKSIHVQPIFSQGQDIWNQAQQNNVVTFKKLPFKGKRYLSQAQQNNVVTFKKNLSQFHASFHTNPKFPVTFQQRDHSRSSRECCQQPKYFVNNHAKHCQQSSKQILRVLFMKYLPIFTLGLRSLY